jgi:superfamily II DNA or RNA helicase
LTVTADRVEPGAPARAVIREGSQAVAVIQAALAAPGTARQQARTAYESVLDEIVRRSLDAMPLAKLKEVTQGRVRFSAIEDAGFRTVGQALAAPAYRLNQIPGVGPQTVSQVLGAARQMRTALEEKTRVRFDPDARTPPQAALLTALWAYEIASSVVPPKAADPTPLSAEIGGLLESAALAASRVRMLFTWSSRTKNQSRDALDQLAVILRAPATTELLGRLVGAASHSATTPDPDWIWNDYLARPVAYNGLLIEIAGLEPDEDASRGFLPADIAERVRRFPLDQSLLTASLRGYQAFGAKFALVQERVIIGDEMGLGKTVQALAAMCHLAADGASHFLVVCPASVVVNWTREVRQHTRLDVHRLHGPEREASRQAWQARGGVAVMTFQALRGMLPSPDITLGMLVVDEAHYAKNPEAQRTKAVSQWARDTRRVLFLTGTPMENRVGEFQVLVGHLRPEIAARVRAVDGALGSTRFRKTVSPAYLRRNQDDVLSELPPKLETHEWVELWGEALRAYRREVFASSFMGMRQAAFAPGTTDGSGKLPRLIEIVEESVDSGRKVVIFSFFRTVLGTIVQALETSVPGTAVIGPLTGSVAPGARQAMVDEFTAAAGPTVLVAQIQAGGVGLNIQAASVVIIAEPQWNPAIEEQAIARAHRMGQVRIVDVHRLVSDNSVDQRMLEVLYAKRVAFDEYARRSDLADATPDAVDVSDLTEVGKTAAETELQRRIVDAEQKRLRAALRDDVNRRGAAEQPSSVVVGVARSAASGNAVALQIV